MASREPAGVPEARVARRAKAFAASVVIVCVAVAVGRVFYPTTARFAFLGTAVCGLFLIGWLRAITALGGDAARFQKDRDFWSKRHPMWEQREIAWTVAVGAAAIIIMVSIL